MLLFIPLISYALSYGSQLIDAADQGDLSTVVKILNSNYPVNFKGSFGTTALIRATVKGDKNMVKYLLSHGANPDLQDIGGATALHIASRMGDAIILGLLIKHSTFKDISDIEGYTPAMRAAMSGKTQPLKMLIKNGASITVTNDRGENLVNITEHSNSNKVKQIITPVNKIESRSKQNLFPRQNNSKYKLFNLDDKSESDNYYYDTLKYKYIKYKKSTIEISEAVILTDDFNFKNKKSKLFNKYNKLHVFIKGFKNEKELSNFWLKLNYNKKYEGLNVKSADNLVLKISGIKNENLRSYVCKNALTIYSYLLCDYGQ